MATNAYQLDPSLEALLASSEEYTKRLTQIRMEQQAEKEAPEKELVLWTTVAGLFYHVDFDDEEDQAFLASLTPGTELLLNREPDNKYDRWAVEVLTLDGRKLGYLTRYKNETIARMMDHGHEFEARVESEKDLTENLPEERMAPTERNYLPLTVWIVH